MPYRFLHILNIITLLFATTGLAFHKHYCQDKLKSFSIFIKATTPCCKSKSASCQKPSQQPNSLIECISIKERTCKVEKKFTTPETTLSKKYCCLNQFEYSTGGLTAPLSDDDDDDIFLHNPILEPLKWPILYKKFYYYFNNKTPFYVNKKVTSLQTPLFILHQSFLC